MNLQLHLAYRIAALALACLVAIASYALYHSHRLAEENTRHAGDSLAKQLEFQLLRIDSGIGLNNPFPDFTLWKESGHQTGVCIVYTAADGSQSRSLCLGSQALERGWPYAFERLYRRIFAAGSPAIRRVELNGKLVGSLTVTPDAELEIAAAWSKTQDFLALSGTTVFAVCLLAYLSIGRALSAAQTIVAGLEVLERGDLTYRLPSFELREWQRIATAVNRLAESQQRLLLERQELIARLITLQEEERRYLSRELHDEFGQCLAAMNAVATSIKQTAARHDPVLVEDADRISRINASMLTSIRDLQGRLRPAEFDELGLAASLSGLVAAWNGRTRGKTVYRFKAEGDSTALPEAHAMALFRIAQECLTNIAKHASASSVNVELTIAGETAVMTVEDDGIATRLPFAARSGFGLLGIRERANALGGQVSFAIAEPHGLLVETRMPLTTSHEAQP